MRLLTTSILVLFLSAPFAFAADHGEQAVRAQAEEEFPKNLQIVLDRGKAARETIGLTPEDPTPMLDYLKKNPKWAKAHAVELAAIANANKDLKRAKAALKKMLAELADDADFRKELKAAIAKKVLFGFQDQAFNETLRYMRTGVPGKGIVGAQVMRQVRPLKNALLGLPLDTPDDPN